MSRESDSSAARVVLTMTLDEARALRREHETSELTGMETTRELLRVLRVAMMGVGKWD